MGTSPDPQAATNGSTNDSAKPTSKPLFKTRPVAKTRPAAAAPPPIGSNHSGPLHTTPFNASLSQGSAFQTADNRYYHQGTHSSVGQREKYNLRHSHSGINVESGGPVSLSNLNENNNTQNSTLTGGDFHFQDSPTGTGTTTKKPLNGAPPPVKYSRLSHQNYR